MRAPRNIATIVAPFGADGGTRPRTPFLATSTGTLPVAPPHRRPPLE
jgi:hypothetical protein